MEIAIGDVVLIKGDDKHRSKWNIDIVGELYPGKDNGSSMPQATTKCQRN